MNAGAREQVAVAGAGASLLAAITLDPLVQGHRWLLATLVTVAAVVAAGAALRQVLPVRSLTMVGQAFVLMVMLTVVFARDRAAFAILPGPDALRALLDLAVSGTEVAQTQAAPVDAQPGVLLLMTGGVGLIALLVDIIAATLRQPALAGLPLLAIYCVPAALLAGGVPWYQFVAAAAGFLLLISADSGDRIRSWGRVLTVSTRQDRRPTGELGGLAREGRRVAAVAVAVAVVVPAMLPGLSGRLLPGIGDGLGGDGDGPTIAVVNPILDLRSNLNSRSDAVVLTYRTSSTSPEPLRIVTADVYDGDRWAPDTGTIPMTQRVDRGLPPPPGLSNDVSTTVARTAISVLGLRQTYLPLPYPPPRIDVPGVWLYDASTLNVVGRDENTRGLSYSVEHLQVTPTAEQLAATAPPPNSVSLTYTQLPVALPPLIRETASEVAGTGQPYQQAVRLQRWFRSGGGFVYSTEAPGNGRNDSGTDAMVTFLRERRGYCVHFASAMAVMARSLGIPARVAVGFLPGRRQADGSWSISLRDAHAWPELYFQGVGWTRFEPTPASRAGAAPAWAVPPAGVLPEDVPEDSAQQPTPATPASPGAEVPARTPRDPAVAATQAAPLQRVPWRLVGAIAGTLLILALPMLASALTRWRRWRRAGDRAARAEAAWDELRQRLGDLGVSWAASWTPRALQARLAGDYGLEAVERAALARLVSDLEGARYARPAADASGGRERASMVEDVGTVTAGVRLAVSRRTRRRARWLPASGFAAITRLGRSMDVATDDAGRRVRYAGATLRRSVGAGRRK